MVTLNENKDKSVSLFIPALEGLGGGGAEQVVLNLAQGFQKKGFRVDLVLLKATGIFMDKVPSEVQVVDLAIETHKPRLTLRKLLALMRYLRKEQPTVLFSISDTDNLALWAKLFTGVSTQVVAVLQLPLSIPLQWMKNRLKHYFTCRSYHWVDAVVTCSKGVAEDLASATGRTLQNIKVIYNPMVIEDILEKSEAAVDHPWFAQDEFPIILGAGRLSEQKDFITLIQAFSIVRQQRQAKLIIIGEGKKRSELEALIRKQGLENEVELAGFQMNPYAYMAKSTVFVLSSIFEGFGNVIVEAMSVGTPVVSTNCKSGPAEILEDGKYGKLVPTRDIAALADAIITTLDNPISSQVLQERAQDFALEKIVNQYLEAARFA